MEIRSTSYPLSGVLTATTHVVTMKGRTLPANCCLVSADVTAKIEVRNGPTSEWFEPEYDRDTATELAVAVLVGVDSVRFTGIVGNAWSIT